MEFKIVNNRTNEVMERVETMEEAKAVRDQYTEMGSWQDAFESNEYYGTYRIEAA